MLVLCMYATMPRGCLQKCCRRPCQEGDVEGEHGGEVILVVRWLAFSQADQHTSAPL